ncbi:MAG: hypothetical protein V5A72_02815, partial [Candidatus Nanohaloarchaea archaeon]
MIPYVYSGSAFSCTTISDCYPQSSSGTCYYDSTFCTDLGVCEYFGQDSNEPSCSRFTSSGTCYYNGNSDCTTSGWTCSYSSDSTKPSCSDSCSGDDLTSYSAYCSSTGWTCSQDGTITCNTGDTCSWTDDGGEYCSGGDVVQDQTEDGTDYTGCSSGSCTSTSCSGTRTVTVQTCGSGETCSSGSCCTDGNNDGICDSSQTDECDYDWDCG